MNTVASLPAKLTKIAASMDRMAKLGIPVKAECVQRWADRLAAAHDAERQQQQVNRDLLYAMLQKSESRAEAAERDAGRAVGLLREVRGYLSAAEESSMSRNNSEQLAYEFGERIDAFLSGQAGERENGDA